MPRTLDTTLQNELPAQGAFPGWLLQVTLSNGTTLRRCSFDFDFTFNGYTWLQGDIETPSLSYDGGVLMSARIVLGDADNEWWSFAVNQLLTDAGISLYQAYANVPNVAVALLSDARVGQIARNPSNLSVELTVSNMSDVTQSPRRRVQYVIDPAFLIPPGTSIRVSGGTIWTIGRSQNSI